jgi:hypothetical protein
LAGFIPLYFALQGVPADEWGTTTDILFVFCFVGFLAEALLWPGRLFGTFRYWIRSELQTGLGDPAADTRYGTYFKWFLVNKFGRRLSHREEWRGSKSQLTETTHPISSIATADPVASGAEDLQIIVKASSATQAASEEYDTRKKKNGFFHRILLYLGVAVVGFGAGAAAGETIDQAFGSRKRKRANATRFNAGEILAAGGQAMLRAIAVILFVLFYPIYHVGSAAWHWTIDDSALSMPMNVYAADYDIVDHRYFPNQGLGVIAASDGCIYILTLEKSAFVEVKTTKRSIWSGDEYESLTKCLPQIENKLDYGEEIKQAKIWFSNNSKIINVQVKACSKCWEKTRRNVFAKWKLADLGLQGSPTTLVNGKAANFKLLKLKSDGVVVAKDTKNGRTITFDLNTLKGSGIAKSALSPSGRFLAVKVRRPLEKTFWNGLFNDCEHPVGKGASIKTFPCEYSTEVWDIKSQQRIQSIYWPPGIGSIAFTPDERYLATITGPAARLFAEQTLKFWEIGPVPN